MLKPNKISRASPLSGHLPERFLSYCFEGLLISIRFIVACVALRHNLIVLVTIVEEILRVKVNMKII